MSAEHITNQTHLNARHKEEATPLNMNKVNKELQENQNQQKVPTIEPNDLIHTNNIQRLLSQQSELAKQNITKKSLLKIYQAINKHQINRNFLCNVLVPLWANKCPPIFSDFLLVLLFVSNYNSIC